jgi:predicted  nucleic acid-binding Zn-ribbon protein
MALKASPDTQAHLLELQAIDTKLQQLDYRAKNLPELGTLAALAAQSERLRQQRATEAGAVEDARLELSRVESDVAVVEARIVRDNGRLQASSSVKDVAGLEHELEGLRRRLADLEDIEIAVMEKLELLENGARITAAEHAELLERIAAVEGDRKTSAVALESERGHAAANRATIASRLPPDLVALYERQRARYGAGASLLRGGVSSASGVKLLENEMAIVRAAAPDDVLICPDSQAILVRTSESGLDRAAGVRFE